MLHNDCSGIVECLSGRPNTWSITESWPPVMDDRLGSVNGRSTTQNLPAFKAHKLSLFPLLWII
ncbi:hypothetical protein TMatcc_006404 [Talaromyces marneffei ATCC 18224]